MWLVQHSDDALLRVARDACQQGVIDACDVFYGDQDEVLSPAKQCGFFPDKCDWGAVAADCQRGLTTSCVMLARQSPPDLAAARHALTLARQGCADGLANACDNLFLMLVAETPRRDDREAAKVAVEQCERGYDTACVDAAYLLRALGARMQDVAYVLEVGCQLRDRCEELLFAYRVLNVPEWYLGRARQVETYLCGKGVKDCHHPERFESARRELIKNPAEPEFYQ